MKEGTGSTPKPNISDVPLKVVLAKTPPQGMKSQSNSQEPKSPAILLAKYIRAYKPYDGEVVQTLEYLDAYYLAKALSCLPEKIDNHKYCDATNHPNPSCTKEIAEENATNAAIDTMEQQIKLKFGGKNG